MKLVILTVALAAFLGLTATLTKANQKHETQPAPTPTPSQTPTPSPTVRPAPPVAPTPVPRRVTPVVTTGGAGGFWLRLRLCESGNNYSENTGNGYYGAYEYDLRTWANYGGYSRPDLAPPVVQDGKAQSQYASRYSKWPVCARKAEA